MKIIIFPIIFGGQPPPVPVFPFTFTLLTVGVEGVVAVTVNLTMLDHSPNTFLPSALRFQAGYFRWSAPSKWGLSEIESPFLIYGSV